MTFILECIATSSADNREYKSYLTVYLNPKFHVNSSSWYYANGTLNILIKNNTILNKNYCLFLASVTSTMTPV